MKKNALALFGSQLVVHFTSLVLSIVIARRLGQDIFGQYSVALAFASLFAVLFLPGMDQIIIRQVAQDPHKQDRIFSAAMWSRLFFSPLALGLMLLASLVLGYDGNQRYLIMLAGLALGLSILADAPRMVFQGLERMGQDAVSRLIERGLTLAIAILGLVFFPQLTVVFYAMIFGAAAGLVVSLALHRKNQAGRLVFSVRDCSRLVTESSYLIASVALIGIYLRLPQVVLSLHGTATQVGLYNVAYSVILIVSFTSLALSRAYFPRLAILAKSNPVALQSFHESALYSMFLLSLFLASVVALFGGDMIRIVYGPDFAGASAALLTLTPYIVFYFLSVYLVMVVLAFEAQRLLLLMACVNLVTTVLFCFLLIPRFGLIGAAASLVLAQCVDMIMLFFFTLRWVRHRPSRKFVSAVVATVVMTGVLLMFHQLSIVIRVPMAILIFSVVLWLTGGVTPEQLGLLRKPTSLHPEATPQ